MADASDILYNYCFSLTVKCQETFRIKIFIAIIEVGDHFFSPIEQTSERVKIETRIDNELKKRTGLIMF